MKIYFLSLLMGLSGNVMAVSPHQNSIEAKQSFLLPVGKVSIYVDDGDITIEGQETSETKIVAAPQQEGCQHTAEVKDGHLTLINNKKKGGCPCDYILYIPSEASVTMKTGRSNISITGMEKELKVNNGNGIIKIYDTYSDVTINLGSGRIEAKYINTPKKPIRLKMAMGAGEIIVKLPEDAKVYARKEHNVTSNFISQKHNYNFDINAVTGLGSISIQKSKTH